MFRILKDDKLLSFIKEKEDSSFGEKEKIIFWIDLELRVLQRGRQEMIPLQILDFFFVNAESNALFAQAGEINILLYSGTEEEKLDLLNSVEIINGFCEI